MSRLRVHVVYEHGPDLEPFGAAELRLLRPLTHPTIKPWFDTSFGRGYSGMPVDVLIIDRLISPRLPTASLEAIIAKAHAAGAVIIHAMDDNFLDLALDRPRWAGRNQLRSLHRLLRAADGYMLTTEPLAARLAGFSKPSAILPNALDERLLSLAAVDRPARPAAAPLTLGYMGTLTHAEDLATVLPALQAVHARAPGRFELEIVGVADLAAAAGLLGELPWRAVEVPAGHSRYSRFMPWFTGELSWDIAIAPLADTAFTRCKSDLKHLDYAALAAAGIFSHVPAYSATVRHRETGWLAPNHIDAWVDGLDCLIEDAALRRRLTEGARSYLLEERTLAASGLRWVEALHGLVEAARAERPSKGERGLTGRLASAPATSRAVDPEDMPARRVVALYEYGHGRAYEPHASAHLRLIRPLTHPAAGAAIEASFRPRFDDMGAELVILDRLWRPDVSMAQVEALLDAARQAGAKLVHGLDDNLLDLRAERGDWPTEEHEAILRCLLHEADGLIVSSQALAERLRQERPEARIAVLPNALDERLLVRAATPPFDTPFGRRPLTIGYMGTATHDEDLAMVLPALEAVCARHAGEVVVELIGVVARESTRRAISGLPLRIRRPHPADRDYTRFMPWFTGTVGWDIAIAPLLDTAFRRCKSDVKFLDGCALGAAVVCSDVAAYSGTVRDGETGLLVENRTEAWQAALEALIGEAERRRAIATAGRRYLYAERVLAARAADWSRTILGFMDPGAGQTPGSGPSERSADYSTSSGACRSA